MDTRSQHIPALALLMLRMCKDSDPHINLCDAESTFLDNIAQYRKNIW